MVSGLLDVIRHHVFKGEHPLHVEIAGAGDEVLLIGILTAELIADEMAAVVQVLAVHDVIFHRLPAAGLDLADAVPFLHGHQVQTDVGIGGAAPAKQRRAEQQEEGDEMERTYFHGR